MEEEGSNLSLLCRINLLSMCSVSLMHNLVDHNAHPIHFEMEDYARTSFPSFNCIGHKHGKEGQISVVFPNVPHRRDEGSSNFSSLLLWAGTGPSV